MKVHSDPVLGLELTFGSLRSFLLRTTGGSRQASFMELFTVIDTTPQTQNSQLRWRTSRTLGLRSTSSNKTHILGLTSTSSNFGIAQVSLAFSWGATWLSAHRFNTATCIVWLRFFDINWEQREYAGSRYQKLCCGLLHRSIHRSHRHQSAVTCSADREPPS